MWKGPSRADIAIRNGHCTLPEPCANVARPNCSGRRLSELVATSGQMNPFQADSTLNNAIAPDCRLSSGVSTEIRELSATSRFAHRSRNSLRRATFLSTPIPR